MHQPADCRPAYRLAFFFCLALAAPMPHAGDAPALSGTAPAAPPQAGGSAIGAGPAGEAPAQRPAVPPRAERLKSRPPAPLKRLTYSAREGFALRMVSGQEITAEIRNGAGRTVAFTARTLEAGDWTLRPRNLAPGLYTVLLRTGPNLRALRLKIEDAERGQGGPEWVLERASDSTKAPEAPPQIQGALLLE